MADKFDWKADEEKLKEVVYFCIDNPDSKYYFGLGNTFGDWARGPHNTEGWFEENDRIYSKYKDFVLLNVYAHDKIERWRQYEVGKVKIIELMEEQDYIVHMPDQATITYNEGDYDGNVCIKDFNNVKLITRNGSDEDYMKYVGGKWKYYTKGGMTDYKWVETGVGDATRIEDVMPQFLYEWGNPRSYLRKHCRKTDRKLTLAGQVCYEFASETNNNIHYYLNKDNIVFKEIVDGMSVTVTGFSEGLPNDYRDEFK